MMSEEVWATVEGFSYYRVSNFGRVKMLPKEVNSKFGKRIRKEKIMRQSDCIGYNVAGLIDDNGKLHTFRIHRLVALAFIPNPDNKPFINHIDCDKKNNHVSNLEWVTPQENVDHARSLHRIPLGEKVKSSKLTPQDVIDIRTIYKDASLPKLAKKYGVSHQSIHQVRRRETWTHL